MQQITNPEACWNEEREFATLEMWERRIESARELKLIFPDPSALLSALDAIAENVIKKDARKTKVISKKAQTLRGLKAKIFNKERFKQKVQMKKTIK